MSSSAPPEYTKLLAVDEHPETEYGSVDDGDCSSSEQQTTTISEEAMVIARSSLSLIITFFLQYSLNVVSIFSVGHLGRTELAAVSLSTMTFNITSGVFNGMATCLDTFCAQAYGAGKPKLVGLHFQRCLCMVLTIAIPINLLWWFSSPILNVFVKNKELTDLAQTYLRIVSIGSPGFILFETGKRFLQAQGIFHAAQYVLYICTPINVILNYLLVWDKDIGIGFCGAPLATAFSYTLMAVLLFLYVYFIDGSKCWNGLHIRESFKNWGPMASLALPGVIMIEAEFLAFEILTLSAARLGTEVLAAQSIASTCASLIFQIPFGLSIGASTRIGTHIGAQSLANAQTAVTVSLEIATVLGIFITFCIYNGRRVIVTWFTDDAKVIEHALVALRILAVNQLYDSINVIAAGCLRGQGRQKIGSNLNLLCYYTVAVPLALLLAFREGWGLEGLWVGLGVGILILAVSEVFAVLRVDWDWVLKKSMERNNVT